jgi:tetratricopeptide (TPR) repeat protein
MKYMLTILILGCLFTGWEANADTIADLLAKGDRLDQERKTQPAMVCYLEALKLQTNNAEILWRLSRETANQMFDTRAEKEKKAYGEKALQYALAGVEADPKSAKSHLSVAICYGKLVDFSDNKTRVAYSKLVKQEADKSAELEPLNDLSYHVLGMWNAEIAGMNPMVKALAKLAYGGLPVASHEAAILNFKKAVSLRPDRIVNHYQLAKVLQKMKEKKEALAEWKLCVSMAPLDKDDLDAQESAKTLLKQMKAN